MIILSVGRVWIFSGVTGENLLFTHITHIINTSVGKEILHLSNT